MNDTVELVLSLIPVVTLLTAPTWLPVVINPPKRNEKRK